MKASWRAVGGDLGIYRGMPGGADENTVAPGRNRAAAGRRNLPDGGGAEDRHRHITARDILSTDNGERREAGGRRPRGEMLILK